MVKVIKTFTRLGKGARYLGSVIIFAAGIFYLAQPPRTTTDYFDAQWPALVWGVIMIAAGGVIIWGIKSQVLQIEQYGMFMLGIGAGMLATGQSMVMLVDDEITWTRGGGTLVLWSMVSFAIARYFELSAEIRSSRIARSKLEGR